MIIPNHPKCKSYMAGWLSTQILFFGKFHTPTSSDLLYHARNQDQPARHVDATVWNSQSWAFRLKISTRTFGKTFHKRGLCRWVKLRGGGNWENSATVENLKNVWRFFAISWKLTAILPLRIDILKRIHESFNHWISEFLLLVSGRVITCIYSKWIEWDSEASS